MKEQMLKWNELSIREGWGWAKGIWYWYLPAAALTTFLTSFDPSLPQPRFFTCMLDLIGAGFAK